MLQAGTTAAADRTAQPLPHDIAGIICTPADDEGRHGQRCLVHAGMAGRVRRTGKRPIPMAWPSGAVRGSAPGRAARGCAGAAAYPRAATFFEDWECAWSAP